MGNLAGKAVVITGAGQGLGRAFANHVAANGAAVVINDVDEPLAVGAKNNPTKGLLEAFWDGRLDEVRIYDRALTATQIGELAARP